MDIRRHLWGPGAGLLAGTLVLAAFLGVAAAEPLVRGEPVRSWEVAEWHADGALDDIVKDSQTGGVLDVSYGLSVLERDFDPLNDDGVATAEIFSDATGKTWWVSLEAPVRGPEQPPAGVDADDTASDGSQIDFLQLQGFQKAATDASLRMVFTSMFIDVVDHSDCSRAATVDEGPCTPMLGAITLEVQAYAHAGRFTWGTAASMYVDGGQGQWRFIPDGEFVSFYLDHPFWDDRNYQFLPAVDGDGRHARAQLTGPVVIDMPLDGPFESDRVEVGEDFTVRIMVIVEARNTRGPESSIAAYLRDPSEAGGTATGGVTMETSGLIATDPLVVPPPGPTPTVAPCATPDPDAAYLHLDSAAYRVPEGGGMRAFVKVSRTGGASGEVSAMLTATDGTANVGADYEPLMVRVTFPDGDTTPRTIPLLILPDTIDEPDETVNLALSDPMGCGTLGAPSEAVLTILDNDTPVTAPSGHAIGGTISGLEGSGLVLRTGGSEDLTPTGNGLFTFTTRVATGIPYDVRVVTQPSDPSQICTVTNGSGTVPSADVTDVAIDCVTPTGDTALDPGFGSGGKVTTAVPRGEGRAVAMATDGRIIVAGSGVAEGSRDFVVARYNADGSLDTSFGRDGIVNTDVSGGGSDEGQDVAIAADGGIVVVGFGDNRETRDDFVVARYIADGSPDMSFGGGGVVVTDSGGTERAYGVAIDNDGRIVVAGHAGGTGNDFAVARYNVDGTLDETFGDGGKVTTEVVGQADFAHTVALQPDGAIVVGGRAAPDGGGPFEFALVRYMPDGSLDPTFGSGGIALTDFGSDRDDSVQALAVGEDGTIVAAGYTTTNATNDFALARFDAAGGLDPAFGLAGLVTTDFGGADDYGDGLALHPDGRIVVVGRTTSPTTFDMGIAAYAADGSPDEHLAPAGRVTIDFRGGGDTGEDVQFQPDGRIVAVGYAANGRDTEFALLRTNP